LTWRLGSMLKSSSGTLRKQTTFEPLKGKEK
jgi:hypothetical protein